MSFNPITSYFEFTNPIQSSKVHIKIELNSIRLAYFLLSSENHIKNLATNGDTTPKRGIHQHHQENIIFPQSHSQRANIDFPHKPAHLVKPSTI